MTTEEVKAFILKEIMEDDHIKEEIASRGSIRIERVRHTKLRYYAISYVRDRDVLICALTGSKPRRFRVTLWLDNVRLHIPGWGR